MKKSITITLLCIISLMSCEKTIDEIEPKEYISEIITIYPDYMIDTTKFYYDEDMIIKTTTRAHYNFDYFENDGYDEIVWDTCFFNYNSQDEIESYNKYLTRFNLVTNIYQHINTDAEFVKEGNKLNLNFKQGSTVFEIEDNKLTRLYYTFDVDTSEIKIPGWSYLYNENNNITSFYNDSLATSTFYGFDALENPLHNINNLLTFPYYTRSENFNSNNPSYCVHNHTSAHYTYTDSTIYEYEYIENKISLIRCVYSSKSESEDNQTYKRRTMAEFKIKYETN